MSSYATMNDVSKESKIQCVQLVNLTSFAGQEDCLFLNIYVPETVYNDPFPGAPVMVFIHGGGLVSIKKYILISIICKYSYLFLLFSSRQVVQAHMQIMVLSISWIKTLWL